MSTLTRIGPTGNGRLMSWEEFECGDFDEGFKYELIDGRLFVSPSPNPDENRLERWLDGRLSAYSRENPEIINYVSGKTRVFVPGRRKTTCPEPDLAAYRDYPLETPFRDLRWQDLFPVLVVEVMTGDEYKDLERNVRLYLQVPSIREYWVIDGRDDPERPTLLQHRRRGKRWIAREYSYGSNFTTRLLPGFSLVIDPRSDQ
jgi:Uma2 family endonuclease